MNTAEGATLPDVATYGGWRRARGIGLFGLGPLGTVIVLGTIMVALIVAAISFKAFLFFLPIAVLIVAVTVTRWQGETLWDRAQRRGRWSWGSMRGYQSLRGGVLAEHDRAWELPGVLAPTRVVQAEDGRGQTYGLVHDQRTGLLTATLRCDARSTWLVDGPQADAWVANWHSWLADLGMNPMVAWVAVTVETAPEPGSTLTEQVQRRVDPRSPDDARQLLDELVLRSPAAAADVDTRVSITFDPSRSIERLPDLADQTAEVSRQLVGLESSLAECGVGVLGRASTTELAGIVRTAYDPFARGEVNRLLAGVDRGADELLRWSESGPVAHEDGWDEYRHDSGWSVTWGWHEAPRQQVTSNVLMRLLAPGRWPRRVTMLYRPLSAEAAATTLENEVNAATIREMVRRRQGRDETARDAADSQRAHQAAREEAIGAGVVRMSIYVTVTVTDHAELAAACADIESRAQQSKIRLRRVYGGQAAGFAATLPAGIHPVHAGSRGRR
ncbi:MAG: hypothetical protein M3P53_05640 [Actinomycetota bacterium]|nr:hypothetical protein [Actinomycetota bacterium]